MNREKKPFEILKKLAGSVRFQFYKPKTKKTKPNPNPKTHKKKRAKPEKNLAKPEKTEPNRFEQVFVLKNRTEPKPIGLDRFRF